MTFMIAGVVGSAVVIMKLSTALTTAEEPHPFTNLSNPPLWTSQPVRVDPATAQLQRLPPEYSTYALAPSAPTTARSAAAIPPTGHGHGQVQPLPSSDHVAWCSAKYRSYNPSDDAYRAFDGTMRPCAGPGDTAAPVEDAEAVVADSTDWCANRYKSYRSSDNSYQPFDGGPRRNCIAPRIVADASISE